MIWVFIIVLGAVLVIGAIVGGMGYFGSPPADKHHRSMTDNFIDWMM